VSRLRVNCVLCSVSIGRLGFK